MTSMRRHQAPVVLAFVISVFGTLLITQPAGWAQPQCFGAGCDYGQPCPMEEHCSHGNCCYRGPVRPDWPQPPQQCGGVPPSPPQLPYRSWGYHVSPNIGVGQPNLPPLGATAAESTAPMVARGVRHFEGMSAALQRATHNNVLDFASGSPLLKEIDFELPFGSATFRHVRTYANYYRTMGIPGRTSDNTFGAGVGGGLSYPGDFALPTLHGASWDWNGLGWMMGEAPFLVLDTQYWWNIGEPRMAFMIPDAHHSVPFVFEQGSMKYVAPAWYDAQLNHNGQLASDGSWVNKPTEVYVWLHKRAVKYTFEMQPGWVPPQMQMRAPYFDDFGYGVWPSDESGERWGLPDAGILRRIEDRYGNRIEIEYAGDEGNSYCCPYRYLDNQDVRVRACCKKCGRLGQIKAVKLYAASNPAQAVWTLLYTYRTLGYHCARSIGPGEVNVCDLPSACYTFNCCSGAGCTCPVGYNDNPNWTAPGYLGDVENSNPRMLHSIHVYDSDLNTSAFGELTLTYPQFCSATSLEQTEQLEHASIPSNWKLKSVYLYDELAGYSFGPDPAYKARRCPIDCAVVGGAIDIFPQDPARSKGTDDVLAHTRKRGGHLIKASVFKRSDNYPQIPASEQNTIYRYGVTKENAQNLGYGDLTLRMVLNSDRISALLRSNPSLTVNALLTLPANYLVSVANPNTQEFEQKTIEQIASLQFTSDFDLINQDELRSLRDWLNLPPGRAAWSYDGGNGFEYLGDANTTFRPSVIDRRDGSRSGSFKMYGFRVYPVRFDSEEWCDFANPAAECIKAPSHAWTILGFVSNLNIPKIGGPSGDATPNSSYPEYFYPYRYITRCHDDFAGYSNCDNLPNPENLVMNRIHQGSGSSALQPFHVAVLDELSDGPGYNFVTRRGLKSRRVVEMLANGAVVRDRTWSFSEDGQGSLTEQIGQSETTIRDCRGRPIEVRSTGWDSPQNASSKQNEGLIRVFEYPDLDCPSRDPETGSCICNSLPALSTELVKEPSAAGLKRGVNGVVNYTLAVSRHPERPDLILSSTEFPVPVTTPNPSLGHTTTQSYVFEDPSNVKDSAILEKVITGPAAPISEGGEPLSPVQHEIFDTSGNRVWLGRGNSGQSGLVEFFVDYAGFDTKGRPLLEVLDATPGNGVPSFPSGFARVSSLPALNHRTSYEYDEMFGLVRKILPDLREDRAFYKIDEQDHTKLTKWEFKDLVLASGGLYSSSAVGMITYVEGDDFKKTEQVKWQGSFAPDHTAPHEVIAAVEGIYDEFGRMSGIQRSSASGTMDGPKALSTINFSGQISRTLEPDGTITRYLYDQLGRLTHTLGGTMDQHEVWGTLDPPDDPCEPAVQNLDNLVLKEKRYYGSGVFNADRLTQIRTIRDKPLNQYFEVLPDVCSDPNPPPNCACEPIPENNEDQIGALRKIEYDWRMRPVWAEELDEDGSRLSIVVTLFDHLDRERFIAQYGPAGITAEAARALGEQVAAQGEDFNVQLILSTNALLSLTERLYNPQGEVREERQYDVAAQSASQFLASKDFKNYLGRVVESKAPNNGVTKTLYDAKGRVAQVKKFGAGIEVGRFEYLYDSADRSVRIVEWKRKNDTAVGGASLDNRNAIKTYRFSWYDSADRVIATADFGTNNAQDSYSNGALPIGNTVAAIAAAVPATFNGDGFVNGCNRGAFGGKAKIQCTLYNAQGVREREYLPDGTETLYVFSEFKQPLLEIRNAAAPNAAYRQVKAYFYEPATGRLKKIAAVLPSHRAGGVTQYDHINWAASDESLQVTELVYGATVVDLNGNPISANNSFIGEVRYPNGSTGQPSEQDKFIMTYYNSGLVASRTDGRGVTLAYRYDSLGRKTETLVVDGAVYNSAPGINTPADRVARIAYEYTADGMPRLVTAYRPDGTVLSQNEFSYTNFGNVDWEKQAHFGLVTADTAKVDYGWSFSPAAAGNYNRLATLGYPEIGALIQETVLQWGYGAAGSPGEALNRVDKISRLVGGQPEQLVDYDYFADGRRVGMRLGNAATQSFSASGNFDGLDRFGRVKDLSFQRVNGGCLIHSYQYGYDLMDNLKYERVSQRGHYNDRSGLYGYDGLQRLVNAKRGRLNDLQSALVETSPQADTQWQLDNVGNWAGGDSSAGSLIQQTTGGYPGKNRRVHHQAGASNRIERRYQNGVEEPSFLYDHAGNIVFDGTHVFRYDGLNHLIEVRLPGDAVLDQAGAVIQGTLGALVASYAYDGFGRLIVRGGSGRLEHYYYDGVRRVSETVSGGAESAREYVYGPDDVDDLVAQVQYAGQSAVGVLSYFLQSRNLDVVGLIDGVGQLLQQNLFSPYGELEHQERYDSSVVNRAGFQGLLWDSFSMDLALKHSSSTLDQGKGLYYARNRFFSPELGRFLQRDPRASAQPIMESAMWGGGKSSVGVNGVDIGGHYRDGMNLYQLLSANPLRSRDPLGLYDPFEEVDDILSDISGERAAAAAAVAAKIGMALNVAQLVGQMAFSFMPGADALTLLIKLAQGGDDITFEDIAFAGLDIAGLGIIAKVTSKLVDTLKVYGRNSQRIMNKVDEVADLARAVIGCLLSFEGRTLVWMGDGSFKPISDVKIGDMVKCDRNPEANDGPESCEVVTHFAHEVSSLVAVEINSETKDGMVLATAGHPFYAEGRKEFCPLIGLEGGAVLRSETGQSVRIGERSEWQGATVVHNLEVLPAHSYYVTEFQLLVHNRCPKAGGKYRRWHGKGTEKFKPPKNWDGNKVQLNGHWGYPDKQGRVWEWSPKGKENHPDHYDIQLPGGGHIQVWPDPE